MMPGRLIFHEEYTPLGDPQKEFSVGESRILGGPGQQVTTTGNSCPRCTEQLPEAQEGWLTYPVFVTGIKWQSWTCSRNSPSLDISLFTVLEDHMGQGLSVT